MPSLRCRKKVLISADAFRALQNSGAIKTLEGGLGIRLRYEVRDNADSQPANDFDDFVGQRVRLHLRARAHPMLSVSSKRKTYDLSTPPTDRIIHGLATKLHQAYLDWQLPGNCRWGLCAGRG